LFHYEYMGHSRSDRSGISEFGMVFLQDDPMMIRAQPASSSQSQTQLKRHVKSWASWGSCVQLHARKIVNGISTLEMRFSSRLRRSVVVSISRTQRGFMPRCVVPAIKARYKLRYRVSKGKLRKTSRVESGLRGIYRLRLEFERLDAIICLILLFDGR